MFDEKNKENDWGLGEIPELMEQLFGDDPDFIDPSDIKRIADDMKDLFFGKYNCELNENRVILPFESIKVWAVAELADDGIYRNMHEKYIILANKLSRFNSDEITILESGECVFDECGLWELPDTVAGLLDSESLICEGLGMYAELMTQKTAKQNEAKIIKYMDSLNNKRK